MRWRRNSRSLSIFVKAISRLCDFVTSCSRSSILSSLSTSVFLMRSFKMFFDSVTSFICLRKSFTTFCSSSVRAVFSACAFNASISFLISGIAAFAFSILTCKPFFSFSSLISVSEADLTALSREAISTRKLLRISSFPRRSLLILLNSSLISSISVEASSVFCDKLLSPCVTSV